MSVQSQVYSYRTAPRAKNTRPARRRQGSDRFGAVILLLGLAMLIASGCAGPPVGPLDLPSARGQWTAASQTTAELSGNWLDDFSDPRLDALVGQALNHNYDLQAAAARLEQARARARIAGTALLPRIDASIEAGRSTSVNPGGAPTDRFGLAAEVSWEADLWGRLNNTARAAAQDAAAQAADYQGARLLLGTEVARAWFALVEANQQLELARHTQESFRRSLQVIEERYRLGLNSALDVRLARTDTAAAESGVAFREREQDAALRALEVLTGQYPAGEPAGSDALPLPRGAVPAGMPAEVLARRPDLVAAERRLDAAGERVEQARKNRLPAIRLTAAGGIASDELRQLLDWNQLVWNLLAGLTQPVFQGGRLQAEEALARAEHRELWAGYAQAVLNAFREVETALVADARYAEQIKALTRASLEAREAETLAVERYRQGLADIITLLEARRRAFNARSTEIRTLRERLDNRVALYLALGGGFNTRPTSPAEVSP